MMLYTRNGVNTVIEWIASVLTTITAAMEWSKQFNKKDKMSGIVKQR